MLDWLVHALRGFSSFGRIFDASPLNDWVFRTKSANRFDSNPPLIPVQLRQPFRRDSDRSPTCEVELGSLLLLTGLAA